MAATPQPEGTALLDRIVIEVRVNASVGEDRLDRMIDKIDSTGLKRKVAKAAQGYLDGHKAFLGALATALEG